MLSANPSHIRSIIREMSRQGFSLANLFDNTSLTLEKLNTQQHIPASEVEFLTKNVVDITGDPAWPLMHTNRFNACVPGFLGAAAYSAPTLRAGLRLLESYSRIVTTMLTHSVRSQINGLTYSCQLELSDESLLPIFIEASFLALKNYIEFFYGQPLKGAEFRFAYAPPSYADRYHESFQNTVVFNAAQNEVVLRDLDFDTPHPFYDKKLWESGQVQLEKALQALQKESNDTYTLHVLSYLRSMEPPFPEISWIAEQMHISKRTLSRRLSLEGTCFKEIRANELHSWSLRYLENTNLAVEKISVLLGYQDAANFRRAFRNTEHCTPAEYRQRIRASQ
ncbi:AraC family transcriptional regulator [Pseudomaricurvus alkylphenolicus]|uniref:AraC family transcriptional regulator n=1 Tax=Pseudomaricurvus alkylphenolicus TaxID=1306991 RepID=UPI00141DA34D|nr:AraC family transcriptional regulator [Pseudomaricurvus alkylphenolicus]NIB44677.1 AraC family transcriptional regulator [Pseudomaricurvus alkylphenolicus]